MGQDRPVWRPNGVPPEEWDRLSRDDQARWWRDRQPPPGPPPHPLRAVDLYRRGVVNLGTFSVRVFETLTEGTAGEFVAGCPEDLLLALREDARHLPADDDEAGWRLVVTAGSVCYAPWVTPEEVERGGRDQRQGFRAGVRAFRAATAGHPGVAK